MAKRIISKGNGARVEVEYHPMEFTDSLKVLAKTAKDMTNGELAKSTFTSLAEPIVQRARQYLKENGNIDTGRLHDSIRARPNTDGLLIETIDSNGIPVPYAGFIEYGFTQRNGTFWGPSPFIRPAVADMMALSSGQVAEDVIEEYYKRIFTGGAVSAGTLSVGRGGFRGGTYRGLNSPSRYKPSNMGQIRDLSFIKNLGLK